MSTEYLGKSCRTAGECLAKETKVSNRGQSTTVMQSQPIPYEYLIRWHNATWIAVNLASLVYIFTSALLTSATNPDKIYIFGILFDRRINWLVLIRSLCYNFEVPLCKKRPKLPCTSWSVRRTTSKVTSSHSLHQEIPCTTPAETKCYTVQER